MSGRHGSRALQTVLIRLPVGDPLDIDWEVVDGLERENPGLKVLFMG